MAGTRRAAFAGRKHGDTVRDLFIPLSTSGGNMNARLAQPKNPRQRGVSTASATCPLSPDALFSTAHVPDPTATSSRGGFLFTALE